MPDPVPSVPRKRPGSRFRGGSVLPGFGLSLGFTLLYLGLLILIPLSTVFLKTATMTWSDFWQTVSGARALAAYRLSLRRFRRGVDQRRLRPARRLGARTLQLPRPAA